MPKFHRRRGKRKFASPRSSEPLPKAQQLHTERVHPNSAAARVWGAKRWTYSSDALTPFEKRAILRQADNYREEGPTR